MKSKHIYTGEILIPSIIEIKESIENTGKFAIQIKSEFLYGQEHKQTKTYWKTQFAKELLEKTVMMMVILLKDRMDIYIYKLTPEESDKSGLTYLTKF